LLKRCNATERAGKNKKVVAPGMMQKAKKNRPKETPETEQPNNLTAISKKPPTNSNLTD